LIDQPLVSVVIPVLNGERHLEACLNSIVGQTYERLEIVISDQSSSDRSVEIVRSFSDPRIRLLPEPSEPLDLHRNWSRAIAGSTGDFVKLMGQDDLLHPDCLSHQAELLAMHSSAALVCGRRQIINDDDKVLIKARGLGKLANDTTQVMDDRQLAHACTRAGANLFGEPVAVLIRRAALKQPLFDIRWIYTIDIGFYFRCLRDSNAVLDERVICSFRVSPKQLSAALAKDQSKEVRAFFSELAVQYPESISASDIRLGKARARVLAQARRVLYLQMRARQALAGPKHSARST